MNENRVETEMVDLTQASLADAMGEDPELLAAKRRLLARVDNPKSSFGGYNPQRDGGES